MFLKFNCLSDDLNNNSNIIIFHVDALLDKKLKEYIQNNKSINICAGNKKNFTDVSDANLELPTTIKEINSIVESAVAKRKFNLNSSIIVKNYLLNKNEKKLSRSDDNIILTEKEVQLLELFLNKKNQYRKMIFYPLFGIMHLMQIHILLKHIYIDYEKKLLIGSKMISLF